jgi:hypothetical protein
MRADAATRPQRRRVHRSVAIVVTAAALVGLTSLSAGCGNRSAAPHVATIRTTYTATTSRSQTQKPMAQAVRYAACMRSHGLPNFPDPQPIAHGGEQGIRIQTPDLNSPQAQTAAKACSMLLPGGSPNPAQDAQQQAHLLAFARCMRTHGTPNFPDPTATGGFPASIARIDRTSPAFRSAAKTCLPRAAGAISFGTGRGSSH